MSRDHDDYAASKVATPAMALMIIASITVVLLILSLMFDVWLLASGAAGRGAQPRGMTKETQVMVRIAWGVLMVVMNGIIAVGAFQMKQLKSQGFAKTACVLAMIPCCGPCFILGIPFGIWGYMALGDPDVQAAFDYKGPRHEDDWD
jgi:hypothetical protein